jgi:hypothetical protein
LTPETIKKISVKIMTPQIEINGMIIFLGIVLKNNRTKKGIENNIVPKKNAVKKI